MNINETLIAEKDIILSEYDAEDEESAGDNFFASIDSMRSESSTFNAKIPVSSKIFQTNSPINFIDQNSMLLFSFSFFWNYSCITMAGL